MTGYLQVVIDKAGPYDIAVPILSGLQNRRGRRIRVPVRAAFGPRVPSFAAGVWTMFTGLHHFSPAEVGSPVRS
jgi:hypothetical protein